MSMCPYVRLYVTRVFFGGFASNSCIPALAQSHMIDAVVYSAPFNAPAHHITAPAQPRDLCRAVYPALFW